MLEVATSAASGTGHRAPGRHPIRARFEDLHRIPPPEPGMTVVGDLDHHPLARQRVAYEDHPALVPGDAMATVGDRPHLDRAYQGKYHRIGTRFCPSARTELVISWAPRTMITQRADSGSASTSSITTTFSSSDT